MANTIGYTAPGMSVDALPMQEIGAQFAAKMTEMGVATDQVETEWKELMDVISSSALTAEGAVEAVNSKLT